MISLCLGCGSTVQIRCKAYVMYPRPNHACICYCSGGGLTDHVDENPEFYGHFFRCQEWRTIPRVAGDDPLVLSPPSPKSLLDCCPQASM